jgi:hypothetical protein
MKLRLVCLGLILLICTGFSFAQSESKDSGQNPGFPRVVARLNLFNRTKPIGPQTLYTPQHSGVFRISGAMACTIPNGQTQAYWLTEVTWTNEVGLNPPIGFSIVYTTQAGSSVFLNNPFVFNATGGTPISISTAPNLDTSGTQYNAYIILEQLE